MKSLKTVGIITIVIGALITAGIMFSTTSAVAASPTF